MGTVATAMHSGGELLQQEAVVRRRGSGISAADLSGCWRLHEVWPKGSTTPARSSSMLLQALQAQLGISCSDAGLVLSNSVRLGPLELRFSGPAQLVGRRPLLQFWFERLELRIGAALWWSQGLVKPANNRLPFFALIQLDRSGWLAARGRGGGLARWQRVPPLAPN